MRTAVSGEGRTEPSATMKEQRRKRPQAHLDQRLDQVSQGHPVNEKGLISLLSDLQLVKPHLTFCFALLGRA